MLTFLGFLHGRDGALELFPGVLKIRIHQKCVFVIKNVYYTVEVVLISGASDYPIRVNGEEKLRSGEELHFVTEEGVPLAHSWGWSEISPTTGCYGGRWRWPRDLCSFYSRRPESGVLHIGNVILRKRSVIYALKSL